MMSERRRIRVGVLFGGRSSEHEVSLMSAQSVLDALDSEKYEIVQIGITKQGRWLIARDAVDQLIESASATGALEGDIEGTASVTLLAEPGRRGELVPAGSDAVLPVESRLDRPLDVVFPLIHGQSGEDGALQGLFELGGVAYVGAGVLGSAVGMDKAVAKALWIAAGLPVGPHLVFKLSEWRDEATRLKGEVASQIGFPCFVKPANSGSSIGISKVHALEELEAAIEAAFQYDVKLLVEAAIVGRELECAVLGNDAPEASVVGEIIPGHEFYDYEDKYFDDKVALVVPADLPNETATQIQELAVAAFVAIDADGMGRVDFFLDRESGEIYLNEINTIPGFTRMSMYPRLWEATGVSFSELCDRLIELAIERNRERRALRQTR
jgi:D-alanine-D-alanine ligase